MPTHQAPSTASSSHDVEPLAEREAEIKIRLAEPAEFPIIAGLGEVFFAESKYARFTNYQEDGVVAFLEALHQTQGPLGPGGFCLVATGRGANVPERIVGMGAVSLSPPFFNLAEWMASELFWWVQPSWRKNGSNIGGMLLESMEAEAIARGATLMEMTAIDGLRGSPLGRMYIRKGFQPIEATYIKRLGAQH